MNRFLLTSLFVLLLVLLSAPLVWAEPYQAGKLFVTFQPGAVDSVWQNPPGVFHCGIPYLDSINQANGCNNFRSSCPGCSFSQDNYFVFFPGSVNLLALGSAYQASASVRWARPDYYVAADVTPNDPILYRGYPSASVNCRQWAFDSTHSEFEKAWDIAQGDTGVVIAFLEISRMMIKHPDIYSKLWIKPDEDYNHNGTYEPWYWYENFDGKSGDWNGVDEDGSGPDDVIGFNFDDLNSGPVANYIDGSALHGTRTASIAAAATGDQQGTAGAAPNCRIMVVTVPFGQTSDLINAVRYIRDVHILFQHPDIVNMSWGFPTCGFFDPELQFEMDLAYEQDGILLVASAGNTSSECQHYPAYYSKVISVSGLDSADQIALIQNSPTYNDQVDLSVAMHNWAAHPYDAGHAEPPDWDYCFGFSSEGAPPPACPQFDGNKPNCNVGTSYSAPLVSGVAALLKSIYPSFKSYLGSEDEPSDINRRIMAKLKSSTDPMRFRTEQESLSLVGKMGTGRLNAFKAVTFFGNIPNAANDTTLSGTVYISGDIRVKAGKTLRLAAGTVLKFYPGDVMKAGVDIGKEEIIVEAGGKLIIEGTPTNPVKLISFRSEAQAATDDWRGIVVRPGGYVSIENAVIRHAYAAIEDSSVFNHTIKNVKIGRCKMYGIRAVNTDSLVIRGCRIDSVNASPGGFGIQVYSSGTRGVRLVADTVRTCWYGIHISNSATPVESCYVQGDSTAVLVSNSGIVNVGQGSVGDTLSISHTGINGYFSLAHLYNWGQGLAKVSFCNLSSSFSPRSPNGVFNTSGQLKLRRSGVVQWGSAGVLVASGSGESDLGRVSPADSGYNGIYTFASGSSWKYVKDIDCPPLCGVTVKAEWNCWGNPNPPSSRFSSNIDYTPFGYFCLIEGDPKLATGTEKGNLPNSTALFQNYPNPFNPTTQIQFTLAQTEPVRLEIYNILGQKVKTMLSGEEFSAGPYTFNWNGRDDQGVSVGSGTYFYRLRTPSFSKTLKMTLVK